eukprot:246065-Pleurochrysis_carterae.AAC.1
MKNHECRFLDYYLINDQNVDYGKQHGRGGDDCRPGPTPRTPRERTTFAQGAPPLRMLSTQLEPLYV